MSCTRIASRLLLLFVATGVLGCTPWATYPPIEGAAGLQNPTMAPIPSLMGEAIVYMWNEDGSQGEIVFNLPEGARGLVYEKVIAKMGSGRPLTTVGEPAYHVINVRIRTSEAEVDVVHPGAGGSPELVTVSLKQDLFKGYQVVRTRVWRFGLDGFPDPYYEPEAWHATEESQSTDAPE